VAALLAAGGCKVVRAADLDDELARASRAAARDHEARVGEKRGRVADAERALAAAVAATEDAVREAAVAAGTLARFEELADRLV
jgi:hypothetical protein